MLLKTKMEVIAEMVNVVRKFEGRYYNLHTIYGVKSLAEKEADRLRKNGYNARIVPCKDGYAIYKR